MELGLKDRAGDKARFDDPLAANINGALGEVAVARYLGLPLPLSVNTFHNVPDLPPDIEVRWRGKSHYDLIIRPNDKPGRRYVLVTGRRPTYTVHGCFTKEAVCDEWIRDYAGIGPAWFVPQAALYPLVRPA
jgi:hypothetical protein